VKIKIADTFDMEEMTINFEAPVHLCHLAIPHIQGKPNATM
jgi:short-subunit dehydrogenase involved in D-alanine esterification of teichoic acids